MKNYIDGFALPIPSGYLNEYKNVAEKVAEIWKEYGATEYFECLGDDLHLEGVRSFADAVDAAEDELVVFGWVVFPSKEIRDEANEKVPADPRMAEIIAPLTQPEKMIFDASRMVYGGFDPIVQSSRPEQ